jgi:phosphinothricin acetyltransferase
MQIEPVRAQDFEQVLSIYNEVIRNSTAVYTEEEYDVPRGRQWFETKVATGFPFLVVRDAAGVAGFASCSEFRAWPCYRCSVEHSVHIRVDRRGQGLGRALVGELMLRAAGLGKHVMIAGIDADNAASILLHEKLGFERVGRLKEVGFKFGRWLDLELLQCMLPATSHSP